MSRRSQDDEEITLFPEWRVEMGLCCWGFVASAGMPLSESLLWGGETHLSRQPQRAGLARVWKLQGVSQFSELSRSEQRDDDMGGLGEGEGPNATEATPTTVDKCHSPTSRWKLLSPLSPPRRKGSQTPERGPQPGEPPAGVFKACPLASARGAGALGHFASWLVSCARLAGPVAAHAGNPKMAEAGKEQAGLGLPGGGAAQWPLQRYGRFIPSGAGESPGPGLEPGTASSLTWKVRPEGGKGLEVLIPAGRERGLGPAAAQGLDLEGHVGRKRGRRGTEGNR